MAVPAPVAADAPPGAGSRRQALAALCVTEIVSYGVRYYAFPVLAGQIAAGTGWARTAVTAAYSAGNLAGALAGVPVERILHRHGPRLVMTAGSVLGALSVAGISVAPSYGWFLAAWLATGVASAGHWGSGRYAVVNGVFNAPLTAAGAVAPSVGTAIAAATGSYPALFAVLAGAAAAGAGLAAAAPPPAGRRGRSGGGVQPGCQPPDPGG